MAQDVARVLAALDFNAVNSGDPIARVYFGQAAEVIRRMEGEAIHWRHMETITAGKLAQSRADARKLEDQCRALVEAEILHLNTQEQK